MMKYNEWKMLQESVAPSFSLGLKNQQNLGFVGSNLQEFGNPNDEEDSEDEDTEEGDEGDEDIEDDMLDGDIMGAGSDEGGPEKSFPPDDSDAIGDKGDDDGMADLLGGIDPDLAGLGGDAPGMGAPEMGGPEMDMGMGGPEMDADPMGGAIEDPMAGGDAAAAILGPEMGGDEMGGDEMGGDEMGEEIPCMDCNPDGTGEPDPECQTCQGVGFMPDEAGGEMGGEADPAAEKMNFLDMMRSYQKKYMAAAPAAKPMMAAQPKFMGKGHPMAKSHMKHCGTGCYESTRIGTYQETDADFMSCLSAHAKGDVRRKWSSGLQEDALLQAVDAQYAPAEPKAGDVGFAPQAKLGAVGGGGYTKQDIQDIPVLETRKYPTLTEWAAKKARKAKK